MLKNKPLWFNLLSARFQLFTMTKKLDKGNIIF